jgi:NAD(P)-dependent dehydrogenase (short-subunit alcohol dehydrogenase family)
MATGRFTEPTEAADLVLYLASDRAANSTGAVLDVPVTDLGRAGAFYAILIGRDANEVTLWQDLLRPGAGR